VWRIKTYVTNEKPNAIGEAEFNLAKVPAQIKGKPRGLRLYRKKGSAVWDEESERRGEKSHWTLNP